MERVERIYLSNGNNENEVNEILKQARKECLSLEKAWLDERYLFLQFKPYVAGGMPPRQIVKQGKKKKYSSLKSFRRGCLKRGFSSKITSVTNSHIKGKTQIASKINTWECVTKVETEERYFIFMRHLSFRLLKIF